MSHVLRKLARVMRYTTFRFALDPTPAQAAMLARHAGASRDAYNQSLRLVNDALAAKKIDSSVVVPWSGLDLINAFNAWKKTEDAGRVFVVAADGTSTKRVTGLAWRHEVSAQVFEEAAVDLGRALAAYSQSRSGSRKGQPGASRGASARDAAATASGSATTRARAAAAVSGLARSVSAR
jgi:putative transposase